MNEKELGEVSEEEIEAERREKQVVTINCNNNFGFLEFISEDDDELKERARVLKNGDYFDLPDELEEQGRKKGWSRWQGEDAIRGYEEDLQKARDEHDSIPVAGKTTSIEFDRDTFLKYVREAEKEEEERKNKMEEKTKQEEEKIEKMRKKAIQEAEKTGEKVTVRKIGGYDGDEIEPGKELGWVNVYEVATPDGKIEEESKPTY